MREATIILPVSPNLNIHHAWLENELVDAFGGFTCVNSIGAWRDANTGRLFHEPGRTYAIAMEDCTDNRAKLDAIASDLRARTGELAIYRKHADGSVVIN